MKKNAGNPKKPIFKKWWFWLIIAVVVIGIIGGSGSSDEGKESSNASDNTAEESSADTNTATDEVKTLQSELKEKYDIDEPSKFVRGDNTGRWRVVTIYNGTPTEDFALDYARAYMKDAEMSDIHYIVNLGLKTTTMLRVSPLGVLDVKTTEYVDKEEHDASVIGSGLLLGESSYDINTGEKFTAESDENAGTVSAEELISKVQEVIDGQVGADEKITDVTFDGSNLTVVVDMTGTDTSVLSAKEISLSRISSITDQILNLEDSYTNTWETVTIDFGDVGSAVLTKDMIKNDGYGKYFDFSDDILG